MKEQQKKMEIQHCLCSILKKGNSLLCSRCTNEQSCVDKYVVTHTEWQVQSSCPFKTISNGKDKIIKFLYIYNGDFLRCSARYAVQHSDQ